MGLPIIDFGDLALAGWSAVMARDASYMLLEAVCPHGCEHYVKLTVGGYVSHPEPGTLSANNVEFGGPPRPSPTGPLGT